MLFLNQLVHYKNLIVYKPSDNKVKIQSSFSINQLIKVQTEVVVLGTHIFLNVNAQGVGNKAH